ncbi:MAG: hypothetical protein DRI54_00530 [Bacteroidetes bacterium]|nr:MAG: hypothetical protein DRI54_00530 [Bacteroidota bacterium]
MKKITILIAAILMSFGTSNAQGEQNNAGPYFSAGRWFVGGTFNATAQTQKSEDSGGSEDGPKSSSFVLTPRVGLVLSHAIGVELGLGYIFSGTKTFSFDNESNKVELKDNEGVFVISPAVFYYIPFTNHFYCLMNLTLGFGFGSATNQYLGYNPDTGMDEVQSIDSKLSTFRAGISPSFLYFLNNYWALSLGFGSLYYQSSKQTNKEHSDQILKNANYGIDMSLATLFLGAFWYF